MCCSKLVSSASKKSYCRFKFPLGLLLHVALHIFTETATFQQHHIQDCSLLNSKITKYRLKCIYFQLNTRIILQIICNC